MIVRKYSAARAGAVAVAAAVISGGGTAAAQSDDLNSYTPVDPASYHDPDPRYGESVFFTAPDGRHCGILWMGGPAGCDAVPIDAPPRTTQLRTAIEEPAHFVAAEAPTFTLPGAQVLPEGHRITVENTTCGVGFQGTVSCAAGAHGFTLATTYSVLR
ncbi:hypothetical protein [Nocardia sp. NPDC019395]|uniref:hypothetical protein n=1 Tax=Nocardia sp. NPDC019395 TaxID=3154686 RepID=UPI0034107580